jgi:glycosyltransferase involved in cell wall biosynthesis
MPLYNQVRYLPEALNSLLDQTYSNFRLVIADDSTKPGPGEIAQSFAARDHRITYYKNENRMGLVDNWKKCFHLAGDADYFAWVGDHDRWHPDWLNSMVRVLETESTVVLVYPKTIHINNDGERRRKKPKPPFSTLGLDDTERVRAVSQDGRGFGKMVYGLFRTAPLRRAGVFRRVLYPDVMLLMELSLLGDIHQVDSELWYNRRTENFSTARQKKSLFTKKPWYMALPWPLVNAGVLAWNTAVRSDSEDRLQKKLGYKLALSYLNRHIRKFGDGSWIGSYHEWRTGKKPIVKRIKRRLRNKDPRRLKMKGSDGSQ